MTPERWRRIEQLFNSAREVAAADREAFLAAACGEDEAMRRDVASLLAESASDDGFLAAAPLPPLIGSSVGGYELEELLGAGGMGEVYRARDPKLGRQIAIKVLPRAFTSHPGRLARFEREARVLAALNHPNICGIYGFEQSDGIRFLILELVEGETLAQISTPAADGATLSIDRALNIARQIADALEVAHEKNIIHRDLKPANIKITPDGVVKVLDFGLAKALSEEGSSPELTQHAGSSIGMRGAVIGTAAYMSPEQARGLPVDKRTDIWAFGCVLFEMLTGRVAFAGDTISDSIAKILEGEPDWPALPVATPVSIRRVLLRCLTKDPKKRLRDIGDVRLELEATDPVLPGQLNEAPPPAAAKARPTRLPWIALAIVLAAVSVREALRPVPFGNPLPSQGFEIFTDWPGSEGHAEISPDGKVVAFLADRDGEVDLFSSQVGTGVFRNLTESVESLHPVIAIQRRIGFSGDSARLWFGARGQKVELPWSGGPLRTFLVPGAQTPAWSSDERLVYFNQFNADSLLIADSAGRNAKDLPIDWPAADVAAHTHNMVWSPDNEWIYLVHGDVRDWNHQTDDMDIWRVRPSGGTPERLTYLNTSVTFLAMLGADTLVFIAPEHDGSGSWLWALDLRQSGWWPWSRRQAEPRRIPTGIDQYISVSGSRDARRIVATKANPTATLWTVPILEDRLADENDVSRFQVGTERALAPRFARHAASPLLFYLSAQGTRDRVWRFDTRSFEITSGAEGHLSETPAPAPDGSRIAVAVTESGHRRLMVMNQDGQGSQTLATSIDIQGTPDWSPDGRSIAVAGRDAAGDGLFIISATGGTPQRLVSGAAVDPAWSPRGDFIVYSGEFSGGSSLARPAGAPLLAVRPDGSTYDLPAIAGSSDSREGLRLSPGGYRFLDQQRLVYRPQPESWDFWLFDLTTGERRQITRLGNKGSLRGFDVAPDAKHIVFDRVQQNSDIVLINVPAR